MAGNPLTNMSLGKWIGLIVVLGVVAFVLLTQFTSFQIPKSLTEGTPEPAAPRGIESQGSTDTRNNLDEVNDIIRGKGQDDQSEETGNDN